MTALSARDMEVLEFERTVFRHQGRKADVVRRRWDWSLSRYFQVLNDIITRPEAEMYDPPLVRRLRKLRDARSRQWGHQEGWAKL